MIYGIVAKSKNDVIGTLDNKMPWYVPEDLGYFKRKTEGEIVVMGHNTYKSIGKVLSRRTNRILTRDENLQIEGAEVCHHVKECLENSDLVDIYIIGGAEIFDLFQKYIDVFYVTEMDMQVKKGVKINLSKYKKIESGEWRESRAGIKYRHCLYMPKGERKKNKEK